MSSQWRNTTLGPLINLATGKLDVNASADDGAFPFFTCARETFRIDVPAFDAQAVIVAGTGDLNVKYYEGKFNAYQRTYVLTSLNEAELLPRFLFLFMDSYIATLRSSSQGSTIKYLKKNQFTDAEIALPSLAEQRRIVDVIESVDNYITALETRAETARTARSALLHDLLSNPGPNWTETTLGDVANLVAGPAFRSETFHHATEGFRLLRGMNLGPSGTRWEETFHWPEDQIAGFEKYALEKEDICVTMDATFTSDGAIRAAILTSSDLPALVNQRVMRIRSMGSTLQTFLWLVIRSSITTTHLRGSQTGAFAPHVSGKDISSISFVLPPLEEQQRIVGVIESVDSSVAALEIQIASARTIRAAVLSDLLSGNHEIPASYDQLLGAA